MKKHQLCCIGHITLDKVVTPQSTVYMPGGTAFYCSHAIRHFNDIDYALVTAVGATEMKVVDQLRGIGISVTALPSTLYTSRTSMEKIRMTVHNVCWLKPILSPLPSFRR